MDWMLLPYKRYAEFRGRSRRKEYWMFFLFTLIVNIALTLLQGVLGLTFGGAGANGGAGAIAAVGSVGVLTLLFGLGSLIPSIAVAVRRLHDTDRTGWWLLAPAVPYAIGIFSLVASLVGAASGTAGSTGTAAGAGLGGIFMIVGLILAIVLIVFFCLEGTRGNNRFGPDPKDPAGTADLAEVFR